MVNFEPDEKLRKMIFQSETQAALTQFDGLSSHPSPVALW